MIKEREIKIKKSEMFRSWHFWKPIVILFSIISTLTSAVTFVHYYVSNDFLADVGIIILCVMILGFFSWIFYGLYSLAKMCYVEHIRNLAENYEKLTDEKWDFEDEQSV